eukprot:UN24703
MGLLASFFGRFHIRPSGVQKFTLNIGHIVIFDVNQRMRNFVYFHLYFPKFF